MALPLKPLSRASDEEMGEPEKRSKSLTKRFGKGKDKLRGSMILKSPKSMRGSMRLRGSTIQSASLKLPMPVNESPKDRRARVNSGENLFYSPRSAVPVHSSSFVRSNSKMATAL